MDTYVAVLDAAASGAVVAAFVLIFCGSWLLFYLLIGTWIKGRFCLPEQAQRKYKPFIASHFLFSILFMNPWVLWWFSWGLVDRGVLPLWLGFLFIWFAGWGFSMIADMMCTKVFSKWKFFRWMTCQLRLPRYLWIQLALTGVGVGLAFGIAYAIVVFS